MKKQNIPFFIHVATYVFEACRLVQVLGVLFPVKVDTAGNRGQPDRQEEGRGHYFDAIKSLQQALTIAEEVNLKKEQGLILTEPRT